MEKARLIFFFEFNFSVSASLPPTLLCLQCSLIFHLSFHSLSDLGFYETYLFIQYIYLFSHIQTECLQTVTILHPSLFLVKIQGFVVYIYHILYFFMLFRICQNHAFFETCFQGLAINPKTWKNFGSRIYSEYLLYPRENAQSAKMIKLEWHKIIIKKITGEDFTDFLGHLDPLAELV